MLMLRTAVAAAVTAALWLSWIPAEARGAGRGGAVHVNGYTRSDGTYVAPHYRSAPDGNFSNNWSTYGNVNPYTGEVGHKLAPSNSGGSGISGSGLPAAPANPAVFPAPSGELGMPLPETTPRALVTSPSALPAAVPDVSRPVDRAYTPKPLTATAKPARDYTFDPSGMSAFQIEQKVRDIDRARYWSSKGYDFNPNYLNAFMMDQKVRDIERAKYWSSKGYSFSADHLNAFMMDQKVRDIERAKYWSAKGYNFNPDYLNAFMMDQKVRDIERAQYWKAKGFDFNPDYMNAFMMDQKVADIRRAEAYRASGR